MTFRPGKATAGSEETREATKEIGSEDERLGEKTEKKGQTAEKVNEQKTTAFYEPENPAGHMHPGQK